MFLKRNIDLNEINTTETEDEEENIFLRKSSRILFCFYTICTIKKQKGFRKTNTEKLWKKQNEGGFSKVIFMSTLKKKMKKLKKQLRMKEEHKNFNSIKDVFEIIKNLKWMF